VESTPKPESHTTKRKLSEFDRGLPSHPQQGVYLVSDRMLKMKEQKNLMMRKARERLMRESAELERIRRMTKEHDEQKREQQLMSCIRKTTWRSLMRRSKHQLRTCRRCTWTNPMAPKSRKTKE
jgi:Skp family chaperone for outer membrane proteins